MSLREYKAYLVICILIAALILIVYVFTLIWPKYEEFFFEFGLLGSNKKADDYFPGNSSSIEVGSNVSWFIYVHNHMGSPQNVSVRVKLLNSTMQAPDDRTDTPSPYPSFTEIPLSLSVDETLLVPFSWSVSDASLSNDSTVIERLLVNGQSFEVSVSGSNSSETRFRIIFELWVYDQTSGQYRFGWHSKKDFYSVSLYIWFDVALPAV